jgi:glycerol kinase
MRGDWSSTSQTVLRVDGGMVASDWTMQRLADILDAPVDRPTMLETTTLGATYLAGLESGFYPSLDRFAQGWALDRRFLPAMDARARSRKLAAWHEAVRRTLSSR